MHAVMMSLTELYFLILNKQFTIKQAATLHRPSPPDLTLTESRATFRLVSNILNTMSKYDHD